MLNYVPPSDLTEEQLDKLVESWALGGGTELEVAEAVLSRRWMVFELKGGVVAVSKLRNVMQVEALHVERFGWFMRAFHRTMARLASDLGCNTVETFCFDPRLAAAMVRIKGRPAATLVRWDVAEGLSDGRQD